MSATGTPTPNIGLRIPLGTDPASVDDINYNSNLIDTKLGAVGNDSVQDQIDSVQDQIDELNSKIDQNKNWTLINDVQENTSKTIDSRYNEVFANCTLSSGNHICFHVIKPTSGEIREDKGYYFTNTANGSGVITYNASNVINILHPYQNGTQTTYSGIQVYAR